LLANLAWSGWAVVQSGNATDPSPGSTAVAAARASGHSQGQKTPGPQAVPSR
jgi:hypothetical protein